MGGGDATTESQWLNWERKVADKYTRGLELPAARVRLRRPPNCATKNQTGLALTHRRLVGRAAPRPAALCCSALTSSSAPRMTP